MRIILNGTEEVCPGRESLTDLLNRKSAETERLVVERNGWIIPRGQWTKEILEEGDTVEVVRLVGGG